MIADCQRAVNLHRQGQWALALQVCEEVLQAEPGHFTALHLAGLIAVQTGNPRQAIELIGRAIAISPGVPSAHCNLAIALQQLRQLDAALASITRAISLDPEFAIAFVNRAALLIELNQPQAALQDYDRAIAINGQSADLHYRCGNILRDMGELTAALRRYDLAESSGLRSAALYLDRGTVLARLRDGDAALENFDRAIAADRSSPDAFYNRAVVCARLGRRDAAVESYSHAIARNPGFAQAYLNRGVTLAELARPVEALQSFEQALTLRPDLAEAHFGKALVLLLLGDYEHGWQEYEWRWKNTGGIAFKEKRNFPQPLWLGDSPLAGRTILLHAEQGFGDTVQFCRYASRVAELGAKVVLEVPASLVALLGSLPGLSQVVARGHDLPEFDLHCPLMSLPLAFRTTLDDIPAAVPYLSADAARVRHWSQRLGKSERLRIGLVWAGRAQSEDAQNKPSFNDRRDVPISALSVLGHSGAEFYSLQTGPSAGAGLAELRALWRDVPIVDCGRELGDFADTAALIHHLDLVITVDTAVAHLAGALRKRVWILNRLDTCWRWLRGRTDSPWYPTATLYRQTQPGSWTDVLLKVRADLETLIRQR